MKPVLTRSLLGVALAAAAQCRQNFWALPERGKYAEARRLRAAAKRAKRKGTR